MSDEVPSKNLHKAFQKNYTFQNPTNVTPTTFSSQMTAVQKNYIFQCGLTCLFLQVSGVVGFVTHKQDNFGFP